MLSLFDLKLIPQWVHDQTKNGYILIWLKECLLQLAHMLQQGSYVECQFCVLYN